MPLRCALCSSRVRKDGTCSSQLCEHFRESERGSHWRQTRFHHEAESGLGTLSRQVGAFVTGSFILTLKHRHDIRVAIASGMFLKMFLVYTPWRLEVLFLLFPCYWKWSTSRLLSSIVARYFEWANADSVARADMWQSAWDSMVNAMSDMQVVSENFGVACVSRSQAKNIIGKGVFRYHAYMNPSSRRNGSYDFNSLLEDLRSRRLCCACEDLASLFAADSVAGQPTYTRALQVLKDSGLKLFDGEYRRTRFEHEMG